MYILGISAFYHDSAAAVIKNGEVLAAAQEERWSRKKHDASFPVQAIRYCLAYAGITIDQVTAIAFYDKPFLKFERLLETYYAHAPRGIKSFLKSMPVWLKEKLFLKRVIRQELKKVGAYDRKKLILLFPEHHLSHAASAFYPSPFKKAAILTIDGVGEWATASICIGNGANITNLRSLHFPHSLGLLYSAFTYYLGFKVNSGEYKLMGLAPYGYPTAPQTLEYMEKIKRHLIDIKEDGSLQLKQGYFDYAVGLRMAKDEKWRELFQISRRAPESEIEVAHCNLAYAIQAVTEEVVLKMVKTAKAITGLNQLCLAGGVALNCVANGKILQANLFEDLYIQPAAGDAGGALGAAFAGYHIYFKKERKVNGDKDKMKASLLGPAYSDMEIERCARKFDGVFQRFESFAALCEHCAALIDDGQIIGWFQGRMEYGPRALGNRSILGDPRRPDMQQKINLKIKFRESFRPFAPAVLSSAAQEIFELDVPSPYMLLVQPVQKKWRRSTKDVFERGTLSEQLKIQRSAFPAITHVDYTARIQTVDAESNPKFYSLLQTFAARTSCPLLINTSFNVRGEPIVRTPEDAFRCFMQTEMDYLVIGNYVFDKRAQEKWTTTGFFEPD